MFIDRDGDGASLWFDAKVFSDPSFDAKAYVDDLRRYVSLYDLIIVRLSAFPPHLLLLILLSLRARLWQQVPLETLQSRLNEHGEALRARLIEVVNEDYDDFVSLSTKMVDVDGATAKLQAPLATIRARIEHTKAEVLHQITALEELRAKKQAAASARLLLEIAQDAVQGMAKVEHLVQELLQNDDTSTAQLLSDSTLNKSETFHEGLESRARLLDRLCSEVSKLQYVVSRGEAVPLVRSLGSPRLEKAALVVYESLDAALSDVLQAQNPAALSLLLHAYATLDRGRAAEQVVRRRAIAPIIETAVASDGDKLILNSAFTSSQSAAERVDQVDHIDYVDVLSKISNALEEEAGSFLRAVMSTTSNAGGEGTSHRVSFDFIGASVLPEALKALDTLCPSASSPGIPRQFHRNYLAAMNFLSALEELCHTKPQVERFRASDSYREWVRKWNLKAFFSLCYQQVAGGLEDELDGGLAQLQQFVTSGGDSIAPKSTYYYSFSSAADDALMKCVDESMYLYALSDKFLRLGLQVVSRFAAWVRQEPLGVMDEPSSVGNTANTTPTFTTNITPTITTVDPLIALWADVQRMKTSALQARFLQAMKKKLLQRENNDPSESGTSERGSSLALVEACDDASRVLEVSSSLILDRVADIVADECCESLKHVRGIVATFRMTARSAPTRPAQYASTLTVPINTILLSRSSNGQGATLTDAARQTVIVSVVDRVASRYAALVAETLSTVRKTESSLRRLKSRKEGLSTTAGESSVVGGPGTKTADELIAKQFELDIAEFISKVAALGVNVDGVESLKALLETALLTMND